MSKELIDMVTAQIDITALVDAAALAKDIARELATLIKPQVSECLPPCNAKGSSVPFKQLRLRIDELGMTHIYFAKILGKKVGLEFYPHTLSKRMTGKVQWQLNEMYAAMDILKLPYDLLPEYFPKGGISKAIKTPVERGQGNAILNLQDFEADSRSYE